MITEQSQNGGGIELVRSRKQNWGIFECIYKRRSEMGV